MTDGGHTAGMEQRLVRAEQRIWLLVVAVIVIGLRTCSSEPADEYKAHTFTIVDKKGKEVGVFGALPDGAMMALLHKGQIQVELRATQSDGARLIINYPDGKPGVEATIEPGGPGAQMAESVGTEANRPSAQVSILSDGGAHLWSAP